jgi:alkylation response protein AidB-like acyl-CoA dehydrogenase
MLRMMSFAEEVLGPYAQLGEGSQFAVKHGRWMHSYLYARAQTIAGGTSEIQRNDRSGSVCWACQRDELARADYRLNL